MLIRSVFYSRKALDQSPVTMRARCSAFRYCPDTLGIVTVLDKLEFDNIKAA